MQQEAAIQQKVQELSDAMKAEGLWKRDEPEWVNNFRNGEVAGAADFFEWLQFVYLPNRLLSPTPRFKSGDGFLVLQAKKFAADKLTSTNIIRLLVELDSLRC